MYTDPGSSLFLIQVAIVGVLTVLFRVRGRVMQFFRKGRPQGD
jgi:hypothetical protein